ncbi:hypothetical protein JTE90_011686 [Oedothorax gibbosus]|uniref:Fibroblast growth factor receptor n=1 Tax=Oedothorax gibbosus TaxID=931172 RepID=A0AAV6UUX1_9ARAC|nr:hypothetical protein JTE90_011686 [Oedothorax gibbosus]
MEPGIICAAILSIIFLSNSALGDDIISSVSETLSLPRHSLCPAIEVTLNESKISLPAFSDVSLKCPIKEIVLELAEVKWLKNEKVLEETDHMNFTGVMLNILNVTKRDEGEYSCVVLHSTGSIQQFNSTLHILYNVSRPNCSDPLTLPLVMPENVTFKTTLAPTIATFTTESYVPAELGSEMVLKCPIQGNYSQISWYINGTLLTKSKYIKLDGIRLVIKIMKVEDAGRYSCLASSKDSLINATFLVETNHGSPHPPYFTKPDIMTELVVRPAGQTIILKCPADGNPTPNITWYKDNKLLQKDDRIRFTKYNLKLEHLTTQDDAGYTCVVSNSQGNISFTYTVEAVERMPVRPIIHENYPSNQTVYLGDTAEFECRFLSDSHPSIYWIKFITINGSRVNEEGVPYYKEFESTKTGPTTSFLALENVTYEDAGLYGCNVHNSIGVTMQNAWLTVLPRPVIEDQIQEPDHLLSIGIGVGLFALVFAGVVFCVLYQQNKREKKRLEQLAASKPVSVFLKKKVVVVRQASDDSQGLCSPLIRIQGFDGNYDTSSTGMSEYEVPLDPHWEFPRNKLTFGKPLGKGEFGQVVQAEAVGLNGSQMPTIVAVKMLKDGHNDKDFIDLMSEAEMMKMVGKHAHIINLLGCCTQNGPLFVIVEYAANGNLRDYLRARRPVEGYEISNSSKDLTTEKTLMTFAYQVAKGMEYLASKKCVHRDLAARNVLVMEDKVLKIADFGLARDVHENDYYRKSKSGLLPIKWMALESLTDRLYTTQSDVWSFGVLMWEIVTLGGIPYSAIPPEKFYSFLKSGHRLPKPTGCRMEIHLLMLDCWSVNPQERPTFATLVRKLESVVVDSLEVEYLNLEYDCQESSSDESDIE